MLAVVVVVTTLTTAVIKLVVMAALAVAVKAEQQVKMALRFKLLLVHQTQAVVEVVGVITRTAL